MKDFPQNIVFGDYFNDIESSTKALGTVDLRALFQLEIQDRFSVSRHERRDELVQERRNVIIQGGCVHVSGCRQPAYLAPPLFE